MGVLQRMSPLFRRKSSRNNNTVAAIEAEVDYIVQRSPFLKAKAAETMEKGEEERRRIRPQHDDIINNNEDHHGDEETTTTSSIPPPPPPTFTRKEYQIGALLGSGSFSTVHAIAGFKLSSPSSSSSSSSSNNKRRRKRRGSSRSICSTSGRPLLQKVSSVSSCLTSDTSTFFNTTTAAAASASTPLTPTTASTDLRTAEEPNNNNNNNNNSAADEEHNQVARYQLSQSVVDTKTGESRYAVKVVKKELLKNKGKKGGSSSPSYSPNAFRNAAADLIVEAMYLAAFDHPNILKLRGIAKGGCSSFLDGKHDGFFMIVDRLQETLDDRIQQWKMMMTTTNNNHNVNNNSLPSHERLTQQVNYALQMADALSYLHDRRILFRDLKPSNIGFKKDTPHTVQLFDFGLARELPPNTTNTSSSGFFSQEDHAAADNNNNNNNNDHHNINESFQMSGAGTFVYMSPEAINSRTYNLKADVYSWSMVTMEMIALQRPFEEFTPEEHKEFVCEIGQRPSFSSSNTTMMIPQTLQNVLKLAWEQDPIQRLTMRQVTEHLQPILHELESYDHEGIPEPIPPPPPTP